MSVTLNDLLDYLHVNERPEEMATPNYSDGQTAVIQRCLDAVLAHLDVAYVIPATPTSDIDQAVLIQAARLVNRQKTPTGVLDVGAFGPIRISGLDTDVALLLEPYKAYRFSRSLEDIAADE